MIMDGKKVAARVEDALRQSLLYSTEALSLGILFVGDDPASCQYVRTKEKFGERIGVAVKVIELERDVSEDELKSNLLKLCASENGIIVQLPLPPGFDTKAILAMIPSEKDVDVLSPVSRDAFAKGLSGALTPPVPLAILALLASHGVEVSGKRVVFVGRGRLVGEPTGIVFGRLGAELAYTEKNSRNMLEILSIADIIVSGTGVPNLIMPEMVPEGAIVIDAGTSEAGGKLVGDANPAVAERCSFFAPVPGGVGPLTVAMLFVNLLALRGLVQPQDLLQSLQKSV